jgi:hypothetical protein
MEFMKSSPLGNPSRSQARLDESGRVARDIVAHEAAVRLKNTERLKAQRLARDAALPPPEPVVAAPAKTRKKKASS